MIGARSPVGSPPLTWGKVTLSDLIRPGGQDHPHLRGEKSYRAAFRPHPAGSPPLTWGKVLRSITIPQFHRITPTYVGKSVSPPNPSWPRRDHPHLRGEKLPMLKAPVPVGGSPPLTWGKGRWLWNTGMGRRITPTYVGKRTAGGYNAGKPGDHPHLRGEKLFHRLPTSKGLGSPPLAWGKVRGSHPLAAAAGITPTCVGKSTPWTTPGMPGEDHPHLRGEKCAA